jgi:hypothetical protein
VSTNDFGSAPAGWYPDPMGLPQLRWWDSIGWTQEVAEARAPMIMRETAEKRFARADEELPTRRERREQRRREREAENRGNVDLWRPDTATLRQLEAPEWQSAPVDAELASVPDSAGGASARPAAAVATTARETFKPGAPADPETSAGQAAEPDYSRFFDWDPEPDLDAEFASFRTDPDFTRIPPIVPPAAPYRSADPAGPEVAEPAPRVTTPATTASVGPSVVSTGPVWVIALIPLFQLVLSLLLEASFDLTDAIGLIAGIWLLPYPLVLVLALCDRWALQRAGYHRPALWAWALLGSPVYLLARAARTSRESGHGFTPLITWTLLVMLQVGSVIAVPGLAISALPEVFHDQVEQSVASDASVLGMHVNVHCPATPPSQIGARFTCTAVEATGTGYPVTVTLQRSNGWIDWRVDDWGGHAATR